MVNCIIAESNNAVFHKRSLTRYPRDASMEERGFDESDEFPNLVSASDKDGSVRFC